MADPRPRLPGSRPRGWGLLLHPGPILRRPLILAGLALMTAGLPALAQAQAPAAASGDAGLCDLGRMNQHALAALTVFILVGCFVFLAQLDKRLIKHGWDIRKALSEPTSLTLVQVHGEDGSSSTSELEDGTVVPGQTVKVTVMEASSSRLIALAGMMVILLFYLGFGIVSLYYFGRTCQMPEGINTVTYFLYAGLTFFAPYIVAKFSQVFAPFARSIPGIQRSAAAAEPAGPEPDSAPAAPALRPDRGSSAARPLAGSPAAAPATASAAAPATTESPGQAQAPASPAAAQQASPPAPAAPLHPMAAALAPPNRPTQASAASAGGTAASASPPAAPASATPAQAAGAAAAAPSPPAAAAATPAPTAPPAAAARPAPQPAADPYLAAVRLIAEFEGFRTQAYPDPASGGAPWTIGYGFTSLQGQPVRPDQTISRSEADRLLHEGVQNDAGFLSQRIPHWAEMASQQQCALLSFAWNLGRNFYGAEGFDTISRRLREKDWGQVPAALCLYSMPGTPVHAGLLRRRQAEGDLWCQGMAQTPRRQSPPTATAAATTTTSGPAVKPPANPLPVKYFDQMRMADGQGWRDCFSASCAMVAAYWGKVNDQNAYNAIRQTYGDTTDPQVQVKALAHLGLDSHFRTDGTIALLRAEIDAGRPVAVGWLHHGPASAPSGGGHWTLVIGYDSTGVWMHDPYGSCDLIAGGYPDGGNPADQLGCREHYSYRNWEPRWRPNGEGGWFLTCRP